MASKTKKFKLSDKRKKWAASRKRVILRGERLSYNASVQAWYKAQLEKLVDQMTAYTRRHVVKLFEKPTAETFFAQDADIASQARILTNALSKKFTQLFTLAAKPLAEKMVRKSSRASEAKLKSSLKKLSGGVTLKPSAITGTLKTEFVASVVENVALIKSIAIDYQARIQGSVMRSITTGNGLQDLIPEFERYEGITQRKAKNLAIDQTRKAYNTLNAGRMKKSGITKYEWVHSGGGQRPRQDHIDMDGNIYSFDDPPVIDRRSGERGIPGQTYNCGCTMVPVVEFDEGEEE